VIALLDACVAIDVLRGREEARAVFESLEGLAASEITRFEILAGVKRGEEEATEALIALPHWLPMDEGVARRAAGLKRTHAAAHSGIDDADYIVAATALEYEVRLLTTNIRHFPMLDVEAAY
jgi:predicted nucleic acid-binding protein